MSTAQNVAYFELEQILPQQENIEQNQNFAQYGYAAHDYFAQNEIIEQQENDQDIFNMDPDEEELYPENENIEHDIFRRTVKVIFISISMKSFILQSIPIKSIFLKMLIWRHLQ